MSLEGKKFTRAEIPQETKEKEVVPDGKGNPDQLEVLEEKVTPTEVLNEISASDKGIINGIRKWINSKVAESNLPTKEGLGFESTMGIYGGKLVKDKEGRMVYDTTGFWSKIDQWGDRILRSFDEHHARKPLEMFLRSPGSFLKLLPFIVDSKRFRGTPDQTLKNIQRLGLEKYYGAHPLGIEIKDPKLFSYSIGLQDIFRQDIIAHPAIAGFDRFNALGKATDYMHALHESVGGIAEGNIYNFLFTAMGDNGVEKPIVMIPTEIFNPEKNISDIEKKTTDLLDLFASASFEEYRRTGDWESVRNGLRVIIEHYQDPKVLSMVASYLRRGRLTLPEDTAALQFENSSTYRASRKVFAAHNTQRLGVEDPSITAQVRTEIIDACQKYVDSRHDKDGHDSPHDADRDG